MSSNVRDKMMKFSVYLSIRFRIASILLILSPGPSTAQLNGSSKIHSFDGIRNMFAAPSQHYGSAPLWVWNGNVDSAEISAMLQEFKTNGFGGVFVHPRAGLITPYLSPQWLNLYHYTVQQAKRYGLDVWIYDENSYPSGFAGGHVPDKMPESFNQGEMLEYTKTDTIPTDTLPYYIFLKKSGDQFIDITNHTATEKGKRGSYILFKKTLYYQSPWYGGFSYVDLMVKGVTEKFIELTMNRYEKTIGSEFGKTVRGVFSDEPNIEVQYPKSIRWTPDLFERFKEKWGYDLKPNLGCLIEESGEWKKVRHNYYQTLLQLFIDRWSKPYSSYASEKNLEWTGHYWEHEWPSPNHGPDNMAMYAFPQRPGIDMLFNQFNENDVNAQFGNIRSVKELSSVANQLNKARTLSETYGGAGWELSFNDMKRLGDWEFALGINTLNQHLSFMSLAGARKYDYPQSFSYQTPWWKYYKYLNQYFGRLSLALSSGDQINQILIIEPTTTAWMYFDYDRPDTVFKTMGNQFQQFVTKLEHAQVEYDLGSENIIRDHGKTNGKYFTIGNRKYRTVVLPPGIENIDLPTFQLLNQYVKSGGRILQFGKLSTIDGSPNHLLDEFNSYAFPDKLSIDSLNEPVLSKYFDNPEFHIQRLPEASGDLYHFRRKLDDGEIIFFSNASLSESVKRRFTAVGQEILLLDLFTGKIFHYPAQILKNTITALLEIPPAGSVLLYVSPTKKSGYPLYTFPDTHGKLVSAKTTVERADDNSLTIDFCDLRIGDSLYKDLHVYDAADKAFKYFGFSEGNPWNTSVQFEDHTIRRDTFSTGTGFTAIYHFTVSDDSRFNTLKTVIENPSLYKINVNGKDIEPVPDKFWLDKAFRIFDIGPFVVIGENQISITAKPMSVFAEIEPIYILGDFSLKSALKGWAIQGPQHLEFGSWKKQGLPMYGQAVNYKKKISISKISHQRWLVQLNTWNGTVATVQVNNKEAGLIAYAPFTLDITDYLQNGSNTITVQVIGSLKNVIGPFHRKPEPGLVSPWHFRYVKEYSPGEAYDLRDYGLFTDFKIIQQNTGG